MNPCRIIRIAVGDQSVEAMGGNGLPVRFTVKRKNLVPLQPGLFDPDPAPDSPDPSA